MGQAQQVAALANAMRESNLDPKAHLSVGGDYWGLFGLNGNRGFGSGHTDDQLMDPATNIRLILAEAKKSPEFVKAQTVEEAVAAFVDKIVRPLDRGGEISARILIARRLLQ